VPVRSRRVGGAFVLVAFGSAPRRSNAVEQNPEHHRNQYEDSPTSR